MGVIELSSSTSIFNVTEENKQQGDPLERKKKKEKTRVKDSKKKGVRQSERANK